MSVSVQVLLNVALPPYPMFGQIFQVALQSHQWCCCDASYQDPAAGAVLVCWTQLSSIFREIGSGAWTCRVFGNLHWMHSIFSQKILLLVTKLVTSGKCFMYCVKVYFIFTIYLSMVKWTFRGQLVAFY